jgi:hypothetical protein
MLFLTEHYAMKTYWGTLALGGDEWSASRPGRLIPRERAPDTYWIGGWVDPRAVSERKIPSPLRDSNPDHPIVQPVVSCYPGS